MSEQYLVCRSAFYNCYYEKIGKEVKNITSELPFEIHDNWTWIRLSNYCYLNGGYAFKSNNFSNEGIRVIRISDFDENGIKSKEIKRYPYSNEMDKSKIEVNDIIVCMTGGTVGKSLYIKQLEEPSYLNQRVALIRTKDKLSDYLANVFKSPYIQELVKDNITSTNDNISMNFLNNILIPIPPFNEQLRIQSKLLYCEPLIKNYEYLERQLTQLESNFEERLKASILQYAIEGKLVKQNPNDEPASVLLERIKAEKEKLISEGKIKRDKNDSIIEQSDDKNYYQNQWVYAKLKSFLIPNKNGLPATKYIKYIDIDSIDNKKHEIKSYKLIKAETATPRARRILMEGDILYSIVRPYLENIAKVTKDYSNCIGSTGFYICRPIKYLTTDFLFIILLSPYFKSKVMPHMKGDNSPSITSKVLEEIQIAIPSLAQQKKINLKVAEIMSILG